MSPDEHSPDIEVQEISRTYRLPTGERVPTEKGAERYWKWTALVLTVLLGASALVGNFGSAFYVTRGEYTQQTKDDAVAREGMRGTLERLDKTLNVQAEAFRALAGDVQDVRTSLAVLKKNR
jgi:hypothetical protein